MSDSDGSFDGECVPEESINAALKLLEPGQKLKLHPGVYKQSVVLDRDVTLLGGGEAVIETEGETAVTIRADDAGLNGVEVRVKNKMKLVRDGPDKVRFRWGEGSNSTGWSGENRLGGSAKYAVPLWCCRCTIGLRLPPVAYGR